MKRLFITVCLIFAVNGCFENKGIPRTMLDKLKKDYPDVKEFTVKNMTLDIKRKDCPLHKEILKEDFLIIKYSIEGIVGYSVDAEKKLFPYANSKFLGGCCLSVVNGKLEAVAKVLYCPKCREAEKIWYDDYRKERQSAKWK